MAGILMGNARHQRRPLTTTEKQGCQTILRQLSTDELLPLTRTVTNGLVGVENRPEAVKAIIDYSESAVQLLCRKKVKRDYLFQYLRSQNIVVSPSIDKPALIRRILEHWGSRYTNNEVVEEAEPVRRTRNEVTTERVSPVNVMQQMGVQFATWFYKMLNSNNPAIQQTQQNEWGPQHFWPDAKLKLLIEHGEKRMETFEGAALVCQRLLELVRHEQLVFDPNISNNGTKANENRHGLILVTVCGILHQHGNCLGVFEQTFGLVRDPYEQAPTGNNYKIKLTNLLMKAQSRNAGNMPILDDSPQTLAIE
ncbi:uncharacterized protein C3orf38 homolog [Glandiceps talaboti]